MSNTTITARITSRGPKSHCPDTAGAVDAMISLGGTEIGEVTLIPDPGDRGRLSTWGTSTDMWASRPVCEYLESLDRDARREACDEIEAAVRAAAEDARAREIAAGLTPAQRRCVRFCASGFRANVGKVRQDTYRRCHAMGLIYASTIATDLGRAVALVIEEEVGRGR